MNLPRLFPLLAALALGGGSLVFAADAPAAAPATAQNGYHVMVKLDMNDQGTPDAVAIVSSDDTTTGRILNKLAITIAAHSSLPPRFKDGVPMPFSVKQPFFFPIEGDEGPESNKVPMPALLKEGAVMPVYPGKLVAAHEVGGVIFDVTMDAAGKITNLTTMRASHPEVEQAGRDALDKWKFRPAQQDGTPVASHFRVAIAFEGFGKMVEPKWSVAPRPALGSFFVIKNRPEDLIRNPALAPAPADPAAAPATPPPTPAATPTPAAVPEPAK